MFGLNSIDLPFPTDQIVPGNEVGNVNTFQFPLPSAGPEAQQHLRFIAMNFYTLLHGGVNRGPISVFAYNLFSHNRFHNEAWLAVLADIYDLAVKIATVNPTSDHSQVLLMATRKYHGYAVGNCLNRFPELQQYLAMVNMPMVQQAMAMRNTLANEFQQLDLRITQMKTSQQSDLGLGALTAQLTNSPANYTSGGIGQYGIVDDSARAGGSWSSNNRRPSELVAKKMIENGVYLEQGTDLSLMPDIDTPMFTDEPATLQTRPVQGATTRLNSVILEESNDIPSLPARLPAMTDNIGQVDDTQQNTAAILVEVKDPAPVEKQVVASQYKVTEEPRPLEPVEGKPQIIDRLVIVPNGMDCMPENPTDMIGVDNETYRTTQLIMELDGFGKWITDTGELAKLAGPDAKGWSTTVEQLARTPYNPKKWHRLLLQQMTADNKLIGPLYEGFTHVHEGDPMDLLDLELDPGARAALLRKVEGGKVFKPGEGSFAEIEVIQTQYSTGLTPALKESLEGKIIAYSSPRGQRKDSVTACIELHALGNRGDRKAVAISVPTEDGFKVRCTNKIGGLDTVKLMTVDALNELFTVLDVKLPALAVSIDRKMTDEVNTLLLHGFGVTDVMMDSYRTDYADLLFELEQRYSEESKINFVNAVSGLVNACVFTNNEKGCNFLCEGAAVFVHGTIESYGVSLLSKELAIAKTSQCNDLSYILMHTTSKLKTGMYNVHLCFTNGEIWRMIPSIWDEYHMTFIRA